MTHNEFESVRNKIYPWIKVTFGNGDEQAPATLATVQFTHNDSPVFRPWLGNLAVFYVIDEGDRFNIILNKDMPTGITLDQLHDIAVDNLHRDVQFKLNETYFGGYGITAGGDHEAGALCLPGVWDWCAQHLHDDLVVAVPAKDMVVMVQASHAEKIEELKKFVDQLFENGERLLTKQLYRFNRESGRWAMEVQTE